MPTISGLEIQVELPAGLQALPLRVTREVDNEITVLDAQGATVFKKAVQKAAINGASTWEELLIPLAPGRYRVHFHPTGGRASGCPIRNR